MRWKANYVVMLMNLGKKEMVTQDAGIVAYKY